MEAHHHQQETVKPHKDHGSAIDPICGMDVVITPTSLQYEHNVKAYYFCSKHCREKFKESPEQYITKGHETFGENSSAGSQEFKDPICGMTTDDPEAYQQYEYGGETYYFCSDHCLKLHPTPNVLK